MHGEESASVKHEYVDGQVYAMTGATGRHRLITGNIYSALRTHLKGSSCHADFSDAQVHVEATNSFYYPDLVVSCGEFNQNSMQVLDPVLIIEVLSRSSAAIDRREKLFAYRKIDSLKEYAIVHQFIKRVEIHRKSDEGLWKMFEVHEGNIELESMPCGPLSLALELIYEEVKFEAGTDGLISEEGAQFFLDG